MSVASVVCARCGGPNVTASWCDHCGSAPTSPLRIAHWADGESAGLGLRLLGVLLDVATWAGATALAWCAGVRYSATGGLAAALLAGTLVLAGLMACMATWGRAVGGTVLGLRTLDRRSGYPPRGPVGMLGLGAVRVGKTRGVTDPLGPVAFDLDTDVARTPEGRIQLGATPRLTQQTTYVRANGSAVPIGARLLIGRYPVERTGRETGAVLELPDLTRTMSRAHCLLEADPDGKLWLTDIGSANGTYLGSATGERDMLPPFQRVNVDAVEEFWCGRQKLELVRRTRHTV